MLYLSIFDASARCGDIGLISTLGQGQWTTSAGSPNELDMMRRMGVWPRRRRMWWVAIVGAKAGMGIESTVHPAQVTHESRPTQYLKAIHITCSCIYIYI